MQAQGDDDDDDDAGLEDEADNIPNIEVAKSRILALLDEQHRKADYQKRLEKKLKTLDSDLAQKREEVESLQRTLQLEQSKEADEARARQREKKNKQESQEDRIRDCLSEVLYTKTGGSKAGGKKGSYDLDTVLLSYIKPNDTMRYNLTFRIDETTTIKQLREDACKYWAVSTADYILKTMANSKCQNEIKVKDCFKQGEIAQLRLETKHKENQEISEAERKAIQPKVKRRKAGGRRGAMDAVDAIGKFNSNYVNDMKKMGGVYMLLKLRDLKPSEHASKIKLRDIIIYTLLATFTFVSYVGRRQGNDGYWAMRGVEDQFLRRMPYSDKPGTVPSFTDVRTRDEVWDWLQVSLPDIIWTNAPGSLREFNELTGYVSIRVQNVKMPVDVGDFCGTSKEDAQKLVDKFGSTAVCYPTKITSETQGTEENFRLRRSWRYLTERDEKNLTIRGPTSPWSWFSAEHNAMPPTVEPKCDFNEECAGPNLVGTIHGFAQAYDASGYTVDYDMRAPVDDAIYYKQDMQELRRVEWISLATRVVIISFATYNLQYEHWTANDFLFEMPPSGQIVPSYFIRPFKQDILTSDDDWGYMQMDVVRICITVYIAVFVGANERKHKYKNHKGGYEYVLSLNGLTDFGMVLCVAVVFGMRIALFSGKDGSEAILYLEQTLDASRQIGFTSFSEKAQEYELIFCFEGICFLLNMFRMLSLLRLNHMVFLLWHTVGEALKAFSYFCCIFIPTFLGFVFLAHEIWGPYLKEFGTISSTILALFSWLSGGYSVDGIMEWNPQWALVFSLLFFFCNMFWLLNVFSMICVDAYYTVMLTASTPVEKWNLSKWYTWTVPTLCVNVIQVLMTSNQKQEDA
eukprot:gnl/TRDRNA2_/TRDRNA2_163372_c0_seq1.p1 gnl/TRDRNA2_/TRDRNA2_163372_c0~~gnl/TRDRNA2_/TRDRNA2_163372_c0_seq1.p1  ORF type:complete len:857 (-),score=202.73 gnl/TRDRNA2_/TRDRNA2_163372_c0_seq1:133-2703(-)